MVGLIITLSSPALGLMSQLKFSAKFTLVSIIFVIPLLLSLSLLQREYRQDIEFSETEKVGLSLIAEAQKEQLQLATSLIQGKAHSGSFRLELNGLPEHQQSIINASLTTYKSQLNAEPMSGLGALSAVLQTVADRTNLELDTSLDSRYLVTSLVDSLPKLQEQLVMTAALARQVLENGNFTPDTYIALSNANQKLPLLIDNLSRNVLVSANENELVNRSLTSAWQTLEKDLMSYRQLIQQSILDSDSFEVSRSRLIDVSLTMDNALVEFAELTAPVLSTLLEERIDDKRFKSRLVFSVAIIAVLLAFYMFIGMYLSVKDNVDRVVTAVHAIAGGDLSARVKVRTKDEMRVIAEYMNAMAHNLEQLVQRLSEAAGTLSESAANLKSITTQTIEGVHQQQQETSRIENSMDVLTAIASKVDNNSETASRLSVEAKNEAGQSLRLLERLQSVMKDMETESTHSQTALNRLVEDSKDIGQVSSAINGIAEQTNLLALNAAIEAARAGEQGRGFAVVADEVRTLAQRTQAQTEQIHGIITRLQQATSETYQSMAQSREQMALSVNEVEVVGKALWRISDVIGTISKMNTEISQSATEQSNVTLEVADQVKAIASISEAAKSGAAQTDISTERLLDVVKALEQQLSTLQKGQR